jgi:peroxiredoxin Q/BCP
VLAISPDSPARVEKFLEKNALGFPLLTDEGGEVIIRYGIRNRKHEGDVLPDPTALVLDAEGRVRYERIDVDYTVRPPATELVDAVRELSG